MFTTVNLHVVIEALTIGLVLSADSFSAALAMGHRPFSDKEAFRFAFSSGTAEALMALFGAIAGSQIIHRFEAIDHWIAFGLLMAVSLHMLYEGIESLVSKEPKEENLNFHSFTKILIVSFATSFDAFGVGIGLGVSDKPLVPFILSIGFWAAATTIIGLYLAKKLSDRFGSIMNIVGAIVLALLSFQMLKI